MTNSRLQDYELSVLGVGIFNAGAEPNIIEADLTERAVAPEVTTVAQDEPEDEPEDTVEAEIPGIVVTSVVAGMATETVDPPAETFRDAIDALDDIDNDGPIFREMSASMCVCYFALSPFSLLCLLRRIWTVLRPSPYVQSDPAHRRRNWDVHCTTLVIEC